MVTTVTPHMEIWGLDIGSIVYQADRDQSGGTLGIEDISIPDKDYADIRSKGRNPRRYKFRVRSSDREELETFLNRANNAPEDSEFIPFDAARSTRIGRAHAVAKAPKIHVGNLYYEADAEITCREPWLYGAPTGINFTWTKPLPAVSDLLTSTGNTRGRINYMQAGGDYCNGYMEDLSVRVTLASTTTAYDRYLLLCEKMMAKDIFEVGWRGEVKHSYEYAGDRSVADLSLDLHGLVSGGLWTTDNLLLTNGDYAMLPFYGPLAVSGGGGNACLELDVVAGSGATAQYTTETDLSDIVAIEHDDLVIGTQTITIPDLEGKGTVIFGIKADLDTFVPFDGPTLGNCIAVSVAPDGSVYAVSDVGHLWKWTVVAGWARLSTTVLLDVGVSLAGRVYVVTAAGTLAEWLSGDTYTDPCGATITSIAVLDDTHIYTRTSTGGGQVWCNGGGHDIWTDTGLCADRIDVTHDGTLVGVTSGVAYYASGGAWVSLDGAGISDIAAYDLSNVYVSNTSGQVWKYTTAWAQVAGATGITYLDISPDGILTGATNDARVWQRPYVLLSRIRGVVNRYVAPSKIPWADPTETFKIRVECSSGQRLRFLEAKYNDRYWY